MNENVFRYEDESPPFLFTTNQRWIETNRNRIERREKRIHTVAHSFSLITYCFIEFGQTKAANNSIDNYDYDYDGKLKETTRKGRRTAKRTGEERKKVEHRSWFMHLIYLVCSFFLSAALALILFPCTQFVWKWKAKWEHEIDLHTHQTRDDDDVVVVVDNTSACSIAWINFVPFQCVCNESCPWSFTERKNSI